MVAVVDVHSGNTRMADRTVTLMDKKGTEVT